jgi:hypothetical protein
LGDFPDISPIWELLEAVLLQLSRRRGSKDSRGRGFKGVFSKDFISVINILTISAISFIDVPNFPLQLNLNPMLLIYTTDLLICDVEPYIFPLGDFAVILYISKQST